MDSVTTLRQDEIRQMTREQAIKYYEAEFGASEEEAVRMADFSHHQWRDDVCDAPEARQKQPRAVYTSNGRASEPSPIPLAAKEH